MSSSRMVLGAPVSTHLRVWQTFRGFACQELSVQAAEGGLRMCSVDIAHVAMAETLVKREAFQEYQPGPRVAADETIVLETLAGAKKACGAEASLILADTPAGLQATAEGFQRTVGLMQPSVEPRVPEYEPAVHTKIDSAALKAKLESMFSMGVSDEVAIETLDGVVCLNARSHENGDVSITLIEATGTGSALYSTDYLSMIAGCLPSGDVALEYGQNRPLRLIIVSPDRLLKTTYLLAPRSPPSEN